MTPKQKRLHSSELIHSSTSSSQLLPNLLLRQWGLLTVYNHNDIMEVQTELTQQGKHSVRKRIFQVKHRACTFLKILSGRQQVNKLDKTQTLHQLSKDKGL